MMMNNSNTSLIVGTIGGTMTSLLATIQWEQLVYTICMGIVGAICSYGTSYLLHKKNNPYDED